MPTKLPRGVPEANAGPIRILLVICRPRAGKDVPFRSIAAQLIKGLAQASREMVQLDVLRPPTFDMLARKLRDARMRGQPYHVVHFDGHGAYPDEPKKNAAKVLEGLNAHVFGSERQGAHGYLVFEHPDEVNREQGNLRPTDADLARAALALAAENPATADHLEAMVEQSPPPVMGFESTLIAVTAAIAILQTQLTFERTTAGNWKVKLHKKAASDGLLKGLAHVVMKALSQPPADDSKSTPRLPE